jgi:ubiquinone/menaquinone biosynthesis C-methylase UbiE
LQSLAFKRKELIDRMSTSDGIANPRQELTNTYFAQQASYWADIYNLRGVKEFIHQERLRIVLDLVSRLSLPTGAPALEVGCGAGWAATALAERGFRVDAIDPIQEMVDATRARSETHKVEERVRTKIGDVYSLPFSDNTFMIVIAMGVLPWLPSIAPPLREMNRVLANGGYLIVTLDNRWSLRWFVEPLTNPLVTPGKALLKRVLRRFGHERPGAPWYPTANGYVDAVLDSTGFQKLSGMTSGFGPLTCLSRELLPSRIAVKLHAKLQRLADRGVPILRSAGCHYIVLASKGSRSAQYHEVH